MLILLDAISTKCMARLKYRVPSGCYSLSLALGLATAKSHRLDVDKLNIQCGPEQLYLSPFIPATTQTASKLSIPLPTHALYLLQLLCLSTIATVPMSMSLRLSARRAAASLKMSNAPARRCASQAAAAASGSNLPEQLKNEIFVRYIYPILLPALPF